MESGAFFLASLFGVFFGTIALASLMFLFHRIGLSLGRRARANRARWQGITAIAVLTWPFSLWPFLTGWDRFLDAGASAAFYVTMAFPMTMGYWSARESRDAESRRRWRKNADDWLGVWECEAAPVSTEDEEER